MFVYISPMEKVNNKDWESEWVGMPEFIQEKQKPYACINLRVANEEDLNKLSELLGQKFTPKTKSAWYPYRPHRRPNGRPIWVSEEKQEI